MAAEGELKEGSLVLGRYEVVSKIGGSRHSAIYRALDKSRERAASVALKVELPHSGRSGLRCEATALRALSGCPCVPEVLSFHSQPRGGTAAELPGDVLAMELLGENLWKAQTRSGRRLSLPAVAHVATQMLGCIEAVHERGFIHRDIKPSNFALGASSKEALKVYLIDFGLARQQSPLPSPAAASPKRARAPGSMQGTTHYASTNALRDLELDRLDDLWSFAYSVAEMAVGSLPWDKLCRQDVAKDVAVKRVLDWKLALEMALVRPDAHSNSRLQLAARFLDQLPRPLKLLFRAVQKMRPSSKPDYKCLRSCLQRLDASRTGRTAAFSELLEGRNPLSPCPSDIVARRAPEAKRARLEDGKVSEAHASV